MLVAALVILAGVVVVASGRGGEMAYEHPDYPPLDLGPVSAADVALLRPPSAAWGYNMRVTDEALNVIARAMSERDIRISSLEQQVDDLRAELSRGGAPWPGARHAAPDPDRSQHTFEELPMPAWPPTREEPSEPWTRQQESPRQAGFREAGTQDAGTQDAGTQDAGSQDAGSQDAGSQDAGSQKAGSQDAGSEQARSPQAAFPDEASLDEASRQPVSGQPRSDDTVADESIPAVTAGDLPRQAPAGGQADQDQAPHDAVLHQAAAQPRHGEETGE